MKTAIGNRKYLVLRHWEAWLREAEGATGRERVFGPVAVTWCRRMRCLIVCLTMAASSSGLLCPSRPDPSRRLIGSHALPPAEPRLPSSPRAVSVATASNNHARRGALGWGVADRRSGSGKGNKSGARAAGPPQPPDPISPRENNRSAPRYTFTCFAKIRVYLLKRQGSCSFYLRVSV